MINSTNNRLNESYLNLLSRLEKIHRKQSTFRDQALSNRYKKAKESIMTITDDITSSSQLESSSNIDKRVIEKLTNLEDTLKSVEETENEPFQILTEVHGIGPKKAEDLISKNIRSISDLKSHTNLLTDPQKIGLKYFDDIRKKIPRNIIKKI